MNPIRDTDVEEQLSIAYLHAVCAQARMCKGDATRLEDNNGIDVKIVGWPPFGSNDGDKEEVDLKIQLKATKQRPNETATHYSFFLDSVGQYNKLKTEKVGVPRFLVVLFMPENIDDWLTHSHDELRLKRCAYWVSLRGALPSSNSGGQTVYLPKSQPFSPLSLRELASRLSRGDIPLYQLP